MRWPVCWRSHPRRAPCGCPAHPPRSSGGAQGEHRGQTSGAWRRWQHGSWGSDPFRKQSWGSSPYQHNNQFVRLVRNLHSARRFVAMSSSSSETPWGDCEPTEAKQNKWVSSSRLNGGRHLGTLDSGTEGFLMEHAEGAGLGESVSRKDSLRTVS